MNRLVETFLTFTVGASVGLIAGVLLAPQKGTDTQRDLRERGKRALDDFEVQLEEGRKKLDELTKNIKEYEFESVAANGKKAETKD